MILIFSVSYDPAANAVMQWLEHFGRPALRINHDEPDHAQFSYQITNDDFEFEVGGRHYSSADISAVWYRKGAFFFPRTTEAPEFPDDVELGKSIEKKLEREHSNAASYFHHLVRDKGIRVLGNPFLGDPNKLIVLHQARRLGLDVPPFEVVNQLAERHIAEASRYVTKAISDGVYFWDAEHAHRGYFSYTEDLGEVIAGLECGQRIPISLVQEKVRKHHEIRSFFLDGRFLSAAVISQNDDQTATDCRKYNVEVPNRNVPTRLPDDVERKLTALFAELELNTGSVDMLVDEEGRYIFLEINPVGMYGNLAVVCNFDIDASIARWLSGETIQ